MLLIHQTINEDISSLALAVAAGVGALDEESLAVLSSFPEVTLQMNELSYNELFKSRITVNRLLRSRQTSPKQLINALLVIYSMCIKRRNHKRVLFSGPTVSNLFCVPIARLLGYEVRSIIHDPKPHYGGIRGFFYQWQTEVSVNLSHRIYVFSDYSKRLLGKASYKACVLPLSSPAEKFSTSRPKPLSARQFDAIWFGRPEKYKGYNELIPIAKRMGESGRSLLVVTRVENNTVFRRLSEMSNVRFINGYVPTYELASLVGSAKVNLCPYHSATQSGVISFAAAMGTPTIVSDVGALREQVLRLRSGFSSATLDVGTPTFWDSVMLFSASDIREQYMKTSSTAALIKTVEDCR